MTAPDVVIIGGGVVGCAAGYELACAGARVTVIERDGIASHASGFSFGGLYPTSGSGIPGPVQEPAKQALALHRELYPRLKAETGVDYELRQVQSILLARAESGLAGLRKDCEWQRSQGFDAEMLSDRDLYRLEPSLVPGLAGGLLQRSHYELDSYKFTLALAQGIDKRGGKIVTAEAVSLTASKGAVTGVRTRTGATISAGAVVVATGPWAGSPPDAEGVPSFDKLRMAGDKFRTAPSGKQGMARVGNLPLPVLPVKPVKGEILRLRLPGNDFQHRVGLDGRNIARKPDGSVWVGTTEWERGFDDRPSPEGRDFIMTGALGYAPALAGAELVQQTACLRPLATDGLPIIGPLTAAAGLYAATAAGKKGVLLSLVVAKMTAALALGRPSDHPVPAGLSTGRFGL
jgi:glycine oxidase